MRIFGISVLPLLALPLSVLAHDMHRQQGMVGRHNEAEYMKRQGLGGLLGVGDDDTTASSTTTSSSTLRTSATTTTGLTLVPPALSSTTTTSGTSSSAASTGSSSGSSSSASSSASSISASASNTTVPIPSTLAAPSSTTQSQSTSASVDAQGQTVIVTLYATASAPSSAAPSQTSAAAASDSPGISTGAIVGISVAAGVVVLSLIGCAIWRMKKRSSDEDEAIRWPELNRHGDSDAHHALPARQTGQHGIETSPLERSLSNSSSIFASSLSRGPSTHMQSTAMALNGSNFGAANTLDYYDEKNAYPSAAAYDAYDGYSLPNPHPHQHAPTDDMYAGAGIVDDYSSMPPPMQHAHSAHGAHAPGYASSEEDEMAGGAAGVGARHGAYR